MNYCIRLILILSLMFPLAGLSQDRWTLDRCLSHAIDNNLQLKQQQLKIKLAENQVLQSKMELLPDLGAGASQTFRFGRSVDPLTYEFTNENSRGSSFYGNTSLDIFKGLREFNAIKRDNLSLNKVLEDFETAKNDLSLNITRMYLQVLFNKELVDISRKQAEVTGLQVQTTQKLVDAGSLPKGDLLEIQAQLASEESELVNAVNELRLSLLGLAQLLDLEDIESFDIVKPDFTQELFTNISSTPDEIYESAILLLPRIKSAETMVKFYEKDLSVTKGLLSPSLSASAAWGSGYSDQIMDFQTNNIMPFREQIDFASTTSLGLRLYIPIFNNWSYRNDIKNSQIALLNSSYELEIVKSNLRKEIQRSMADATAALEKYRATEKSLAYLMEAFSYTEKKFSSGMLTSMDYNIAKNKLAKAQSDLLQAKYNFIFNSRILEFYRGIPLELR